MLEGRETENLGHGGFGVRSRLAGWLRWVYRFAMIGIAFAVVAWFLVTFKLWAEDWKRYFWIVGDYQTVLYLFIGVFVVSYILHKLLTWELHAVFRR